MSYNNDDYTMLYINDKTRTCREFIYIEQYLRNVSPLADHFNHSRGSIYICSNVYDAGLNSVNTRDPQRLHYGYVSVLYRVL